MSTTCTVKEIKFKKLYSTILLSVTYNFCFLKDLLSTLKYEAFEYQTYCEVIFLYRSCFRIPPIPYCMKKNITFSMQRMLHFHNVVFENCTANVWSNNNPRKHVGSEHLPFLLVLLAPSVRA